MNGWDRQPAALQAVAEAGSFAVAAAGFNNLQTPAVVGGQRQCPQVLGPGYRSRTRRMKSSAPIWCARSSGIRGEFKADAREESARVAVNGASGREVGKAARAG